MVMNTGKEKEEIIEEKVKEGIVQKTEGYEYLGFYLNEKGNCMYHIMKKGLKIDGQVIALKSMASYRNFGGKFLLVRIQMYESCIINSLLYGLEAWNKQTKQEIKALEKQQAKSLCCLLELPRSTPYLGMLNELGIWRIEERIEYRRIMLVQNILKSDDKRLCKRLLLEQQEEDEDDDTLFATTRKSLEQYGIRISEIAGMKKSKLKKMVKEKINEKMNNIVQKAAENMTKMRFVKEESFGRKKYLNELTGYECLETIHSFIHSLSLFNNGYNKKILKNNKTNDMK